MSRDQSNSQSNPKRLYLGAFVLITLFALVYRWQLSDVCWGIWLTEVVMIVTILFVSTGRIILSALGVRPLSESESIPGQEEMERELSEAALPKRLRLLAAISHQPPTASGDSASFFGTLHASPTSVCFNTLSPGETHKAPKKSHSHRSRYGVGEKSRLVLPLLFIAFFAACLLGFFVGYSLILYFFFPLPVQPAVQTASLTGFFLFNVDLVLYLLPRMWILVFATLLINRRKIFYGPPGERIFGLAGGGLFRIHFSLLLLPPLALLVQQYVPDWQTIILVIVLFVFCLPIADT